MKVNSDVLLQKCWLGPHIGLYKLLHWWAKTIWPVRGEANIVDHLQTRSHIKSISPISSRNQHIGCWRNGHLRLDWDRLSLSQCFGLYQIILYYIIIFQKQNLKNHLSGVCAWDVNSTGAWCLYDKQYIYSKCVFLKTKICIVYGEDTPTQPTLNFIANGGDSGLIKALSPSISASSKDAWKSINKICLKSQSGRTWNRIGRNIRNTCLFYTV